MTTHTHEPAAPWEQLGITEDDWNQHQAKVSALIAQRVNAPLEIPDVTDEFLAQATERHPELAPPEPPKRKPRSDEGVRREPKAVCEPEFSPTLETTSITIELYAIQYAELEREADRVYCNIDPRYLTEAPATVLLNSRIQKHWRTLVGK